MKKFFGFGSSTPPPPPPPSKPPAPPVKMPSRPNAGAPATPGKSGEDQPPSIVGRWKAANSSDTTEFHADGTVTEKTGDGQTIRGRYALRDKELKVNLDGVPNELTFPVAVGADALEMTDSDGNLTHYQRIS